MKKIFTIACALVCSGLTLVKAQNAQQIGPCITHSQIDNWINQSEENRAIYEQSRIEIAKNIKEGNFKRGEVYRIPVVFHVLHDDGKGNVPYEELLETIEAMNLDFNGANPNIPSYMPSDMQDLIGNAEIDFRIASIDPNGNPTNGVIRYNDARTNTAGDEIKVGRQWRTKNYLNIYVVRTIASGAGGYAYYPGASSAIDGIIVTTSLIGASRNPSGTSHEVGHYMSLAHTWGNSNTPEDPNNCGTDDGVSDTPLCAGVGQNVNCRTATPNTCNAGQSGDRRDNFQNIMDYAYCFANFTPGQVERMRAAANGQYRIDLWKTDNIAATGTDYDDTPSQPHGSFYPSVFNSAICPGTSVSFTYDGHPNVDTYSWSFEGAVPATSNEKNPTVSYASSGIFDATLTVTNANGTHTFTYENVVEVSGASSITTPYFEGFENFDVSATDNGLTIENVDNDTRTWVIKNGVGRNSESCLYINNRVNGLGKIDRIITNPIDLSNATSPLFSFDYAFVQKATANTDKLTLWVSTDCGVTFAKRKTYNGKTILRTAENTTGNFEPSSDDEWVNSEYDLSSYIGQSVMIMLEFESGGGNNIYLDNFKTDDLASGVSDISVLTSFTLAPNPATQEATLAFSLKQQETVSIEMFNLVGTKVKTVVSKNFSSGKHSVTINRSSLPAGIYLININTGSESTTKKLIFN